MPANDLAAKLCDESVAAWDSQAEQVHDKLMACLLVTLAEAARSRTHPRFQDVARALVSSAGPATALGGSRAATEQAAAANAFLAHALLRDDSYRTALHPGQLIVPVALACSEEVHATGAETVRAIGIAYEVTLRLADLILPEVAERGWRVTALLSPIAAAAAAIGLLRPHDRNALASAVRLAATTVGGPLHTIAEGGDWNVQPALSIGTGIACARLAATGYEAASGHLEGARGLLEQFTGSRSVKTLHGGLRLSAITFKSHAAPMFAQSLLRAIDSLSSDLLAEPCAVSIAMSPFAVAYAGDSKTDTSVVSIQTLVRDRLMASMASTDDLAAVDGVQLTLTADSSVSDLDVVLEVHRGTTVTTRQRYDGDTASWTFGDIRRDASYANVDELAAAIEDLPTALDVDALVKCWQALVF